MTGTRHFFIGGGPQTTKTPSRKSPGCPTIALRYLPLPPEPRTAGAQMDAVIQWLDGLRGTAFAVSATLFLLVNGAALAAFVLKRDRALVNRWTGRVLAANVLLLGTGVGLPLVTWVARSALVAFAPSTNTLAPRRIDKEVPRSDLREPRFKP